MCEGECALRHTLETGSAVVNQAGFIVDARGRRIPISVSTALFRDEHGEVVGGAETFRDLTLVEELRKEIEGRHQVGDVVARSLAMRRVLDALPLIAESDSTVVIEGEVGTGKELLARAIHAASCRSSGPFVAVGSLLAAGLTVAMYLSGQHLRQIFFYLLGSFAQADWQSLVIGLPPRSSAPACSSSCAPGPSTRSSSATTPPATSASTSGGSGRSCLGLASLVTAAAVALAGLIGFVGLVVPHVVRLLVGPNARLVLPLSALFGATFLILADLVARIPGEVPVGVVTAVVGAPVFLILLRRFRSGYEL